MKLVKLYQDRLKSKAIRQIINISNKTWDITTGSITIKRIKEYYKKLYNHKFDNLEETDQFLQKPKTTKIQSRQNRPPELSHNLQRNFSQISGPDDFTFTKHLSNNLCQSYTIPSRNKEEGTLSNSPYKANITWILKPDKNRTKKQK